MKKRQLERMEKIKNELAEYEKQLKQEEKQKKEKEKQKKKDEIVKLVLTYSNKKIENFDTEKFKEYLEKYHWNFKNLFQ